MSTKKNQRAEKSAREAQLAAVRAQQRAAERRRGLLVWGAGVVVLAIIAGAVSFAILRDRANTPSLGAVKSYTYSGSVHTDKQVDYAAVLGQRAAAERRPRTRCGGGPFRWRGPHRSS